MSIRITRAGLLDTIQDTGRYSYRHTGINPTGAMDTLSMQIANLVVGNARNEAVIELHYPASTFIFEKAIDFALAGADFTPHLDGMPITNNVKVHAKENSVLNFAAPHSGARCYLSVSGGFSVEPWLNSYSTHLKARAGGYEGRKLMRDDAILYKNKLASSTSLLSPIHFEFPQGPGHHFYFLKGPEWNILSDQAKETFLSSPFQITSQSDRMGYRLRGESLQSHSAREMISSPVSFGTVQLLPDGQLIILMADHQTTGGYPRVAIIISAHLPFLAQKKPGDDIFFMETSLKNAEEQVLQQEYFLTTLENSLKPKTS